MELKLQFAGYKIKQKDSEWNHNRVAIFLKNGSINIYFNETELIKVAHLCMGKKYLITSHDTLFYPIKIFDYENELEYLFMFNKLWKHKGNEYVLLNIKASMTKKVYRFDVFILNRLFMIVNSQHSDEISAWTSFKNTWIKSPELIEYKKLIVVKLYLKENLISEHKYSVKSFVLVPKNI